MAIFNNMSITNKGQILYTKAQAGTKLNFTKMMIGSGVIGSQNAATLTALVTPKFDVSIQAITPNTANKTATISGTITNSAITEATYICEIGLFATDPDDGEILYAYGTTGAYGDYMAPATSGPYSWNYQINAAIGNASSVTVTLSDLQYDSGVVNSNTTFIYLAGGTQKEINKSVDNLLKTYTTTNSGNAYAVAVPNLTALTEGYPITIKFNAASTGAITVNPTSLGTRSVVDYFGNPVTNVRKDLIANLRYDSTNGNFQLLGKGGGGNLTASQLLLNVTATGDNGTIVGTMPNNGALGTTLGINGSYAIPAGYTSGGTVTQSITTKSGTTINPSTSQQTISAGQYLSGDQIIAAITGTATDADVVAGKTYNSAAGILRTGIATIASLGGAYKASGSFYRSGSSATVSLSFTPNVIITVSADGGYVNIRQTAFSWYYTDVFFYNSTPTSNSGWSKYTTSQQAGNSGNPCITIGTNSFTWQAIGGSGETIYYLALQI